MQRAASKRWLVRACHHQKETTKKFLKEAGVPFRMMPLVIRKVAGVVQVRTASNLN